MASCLVHESFLFHPCRRQVFVAESASIAAPAPFHLSITHFRICMVFSSPLESAFTRNERRHFVRQDEGDCCVGCEFYVRWEKATVKYPRALTSNALGKTINHTRVQGRLTRWRSWHVLHATLHHVERHADHIRNKGRHESPSKHGSNLTLL